MSGTNAEDRPGYAILDKLRGSPWDGKIGLGVVDIHADLRTRSWEVSYEKLANMV